MSLFQDQGASSGYLSGTVENAVLYRWVSGDTCIHPPPHTHRFRELWGVKNQSGSREVASPTHWLWKPTYMYI